MNRDDVIYKVFPHALFGYDPIAVDAFLDEVIREFDRLNNTIDVLSFRLAHELNDAVKLSESLALQLEFARVGRRAIDAVNATPGEKEFPETDERQEEPVEVEQARDEELSEQSEQVEQTERSAQVEQPEQTDFEAPREGEVAEK